MCAIMMYQLRHYMITKKRLTGLHSYSSILLQNHLLLNLEWGMYAPHACAWSSDWLVFGCLAIATDQLRSLQMEEQMNISDQIFGTGRVDEDILGPPNQRSSSPQQ